MNNCKKLEQTFREISEEKQVDRLIVSFLPSIRWGTDFTGSNGLLWLSADSIQLVTDGRYREQARAEVPTDVEVHIASDGLLKYMDHEGLLEDQERVAFQSDHVTIDELSGWKERFPDIEFVPMSNLFTEQQGVKTPGEVRAIQKAQHVTDSVFTELMGWIRPGVSEKEVAAEIVYRHMKRGARKMSFDPIVASGPNGALPHAQPTDRALREGELVVIDMGCFLHGYASDMTRTIAIGEPGDEARAGYAAVLEAQHAALDAAEAGMVASDLDQIARSVLDDHGLGEAFSHSLGHGIGLQIHEWPRVSRNSDTVLPAGAVITIEPGVYITGQYGVRIEDIIVLREGGAENLTSSTKDLLVVNS